MVLVLAICETCPPGEVDVIVPVILNLFDSRASLLALLKLLVEREVKTTSKLMKAIARISVHDFLLQPVRSLYSEATLCA